MNKKDLSIIVPVYNEKNNIVPFITEIKKAIDFTESYEIIFCLDPSDDGTYEEITRELQKDSKLGMIVFSRRFGQPAATMAGILNCSGDACVIIDVDLQDPPKLIKEMYDLFKKGNDTILAQRISRKGESILKKIIAKLGYKLINKIANVEIPKNTGDFRLISRKVIEELRHHKETHGFLRGLNSIVGFKQEIIQYDREERKHGKGNYNRYTGSIKIGFNGIFSFSTVPLTLLLFLGTIVFIISIIGIIYILFNKIIYGANYPMGIPTITVLLLFIGGLNIMAVGILGEYIGRIYEEVKGRPHFIISESYNVEVLNRRGPKKLL